MKLDEIEKANLVAKNALKAGVTLTYSEQTCEAVDRMIKALRSAEDGLKLIDRICTSASRTSAYSDCDHARMRAREILVEVESILNGKVPCNVGSGKTPNTWTTMDGSSSARNNF